ncbi:hypothetical protein NTE_01002 [Candidatus Nitrososphaera evergladensis SR1]|uniref:Uncharacterized protein n=1 Tax=Candidatus Nitrososphaera evergladensis SR1 TaxID=1459636 RepID=A0A075MNE7_9ARCH|nr:hypothetical protein NTE_01002 [Candidatus Nitrososphaera evergladensis SR1]
MKFISLILIALIFVAPWLFELYTFHLYEINDNTFFFYSGARLFFFVASAVALGYFAGLNIRKGGNVNYYIIGCAAAVLSLVLVLYQFCEARECYYVGPDGLGEVRLFLLLFSASAAGLIRGKWARLTLNNDDEGDEYDKAAIAATSSPSSIHPLFASTVVAIFVGIYPASLLYDVPSEPTFRALLFFYYVTVPFLLAGLTASQLGSGNNNSSQKWAIGASVLGQTVLFVLFEALTFPDNNNDDSFWQVIQLVVAIGGSALSGIAGSRIGYSYYHHHRRHLVQPNNNHLNANGPKGMMASSKKLKMTREKLFASLSVPIFFGFGIFAMHPSFLAPIDLLPDIENVGSSGHQDGGNCPKMLSSIPPPMYYSGAASNEQYFSTKRVEVNLNFTSLYQHQGIDNNTSSLSSRNENTGNDDDNDILLAGIGAQSPNCCKDGLDYGYRADVLFTKEGTKYLVARAWETCDQNAACSGFPWRSIMHESVVPINNNIPKSFLAIAMEWARDGRTVNWYYRTVDSDSWIKYSSFTAPEIENPYFNLGVISINGFFPADNPLVTSLWGNVNFFQAGIATTSSSSDSTAFAGGKIVFECPAFYDNNDGMKHCFPNMAAVPASESEWKVLWGWGVDRPATSTHIDNLKKLVEMII